MIRNSNDPAIAVVEATAQVAKLLHSAAALSQSDYLAAGDDPTYEAVVNREPLTNAASDARRALRIAHSTLITAAQKLERELDAYHGR